MGLNYKIRCLGYVKIDGCIWFANICFNALMKVNLLTGDLDIVDKFPNYPVNARWLYSSVHHIGQYLVFIPNNSAEIVSYNLDNGKFFSVPIKEEYLSKNAGQFTSSYQIGSFIYLFPTAAKCMIKYNTVTHKIVYLENAVSELIERMPEVTYWFYQKYEVIDKLIYLPAMEVNVVVIFDIEKESADIRYLNIEGGCSTIDYKDGYFYFASGKSAQIYRWEPVSGEIIIYNDLPNDIKKEEMFANSFCKDDKIIFFPDQGNRILTFMIETGKISVLKELINIDGETVSTYMVNQNDGTVCTCGLDSDFIFALNYRKDQILLQNIFNLNESMVKKKISTFLFNHSISENLDEDFMSLKDYLEAIVLI